MHQLYTRDIKCQKLIKYSASLEISVVKVSCKRACRDNGSNGKSGRKSWVKAIDYLIITEDITGQQLTLILKIMDLNIAILSNTRTNDKQLDMNRMSLLLYG